MQDESGAYPASPTFSAYAGFCWFRDGAFIADGVSAWGEIESPSRFHDWCTRVLVAHRELIGRVATGGVPDNEMLPARFRFDGTDADDDWWDFQTDGYGTWLWTVVEHARRHGLGLDPWLPGMELAVDYLVASWRRPCFDWWEENAAQVHISTLTCIAAGLAAAAGHLDGSRASRAVETVREIRAFIGAQGMVGDHLAKWVGSDTVDASLLSAITMGVYRADGVVGAATIAAIDAALNVDGGVHRHLDDSFFGGGRWPLLSCFLGLAFAQAGDPDRAREQLRWAAATATADLDLPEQVGGHLLFPEKEQEWLDRWGTVATPLLWSHGMLLRLAAELGLAPRS